MGNIQKAFFGDHESILSTYLVDSDRKSLVWVGVFGLRSAVYGLTKRLRDKANSGSLNDSSKFAFHIELGIGQSQAIKLEEVSDYYIAPPQPLVTPNILMQLPAKRRPAMYEGRAIAYAATREAGEKECYCPVWQQIIPADSATMTAQQVWVDFVKRTENTSMDSDTDIEWEPKLWCIDLYNLYLFMSARIRVAISPYWMLWLLNYSKNRSSWSMGKSGKVLEYLHAYVSPIYKEAEERLGVPIIEHGAYRIQCDSAADFWRTELVKNPGRFDDISFTYVEEPKSEVETTDYVDGNATDSGEGMVFE